MNTSSKYLFHYLLVLSTLSAMSATSWLSVWVMLEINLLSFIYMMFNSSNNYIKEAPIMYFIIQAICSIFFLTILIINMSYLNSQFLYSNTSFVLTMGVALLAKIGSSPFHFWLPLIMKNISWMTNYLLMTWQKLAPISVLFYMMNSKFIPFIILSLSVGALYGLNHTSIKMMMAFSSINQIGWMLTALMFNKFMFILYMIMYSIILISVVLIFHLFKLSFLSQLTNLSLNKYTKMMISLNILSLGGMPPFFGFYPKMIMIMSLNNYSLIVIMVMTSLITLFFYLRILITTSLYMSLKMNVMKNDKINSPLFNILSWMTIILFIMMILI